MKKLFELMQNVTEGGSGRGKEHGDHGNEDIVEFLDKARAGLIGYGNSTAALEQVSRFGGSKEAAAFAKQILGEMYRMEKLISEYLFNNKDLSRPPPKFR